ncbi:MAG: FAD-binding oxidoreductase, partial [Gammaproteobacteria bacterium]|nr:FAD-binding oxidoreductase [Gammaproteobacteria bacterium]
MIGAGVIGICTALQLQQAGFAVTLYDENGLAQ